MSHYKPDTLYSTAEIAGAGWSLRSSNNGGYTDDQLRTAALLDISATLRTINRKLDNLGADGIHELIRRSVKDARRKERERRKRAAAKRKAAKR